MNTFPPILSRNFKNAYILHLWAIKSTSPLMILCVFPQLPNIHGRVCKLHLQFSVEF